MCYFTLTFSSSLRDFLSNTLFSPGTSYTRNSDVALEHITGLVARKASQQRWTKYNPQNLLATTPDL